MRLAQLAHRLHLALGQHLGHDLVDPEPIGNRARGAGVVAGDHGHLDSKRMQRVDGAGRIGLDWIGNGEDRGQAAIDRGIQR